MPLPKRAYHKRGELVEGYEARKHPLYGTWHQMLHRCYVEDNVNFKNYGGRGIKVCDEWLHFKNFVADMGPKPTKFHTLERVNNELGYSKFNCRWATRSEQCVNRRVFKNNTSGSSGVVACRSRYHARFDFEGVRYNIGRFDSVEDATLARSQFIDLFFKDFDAAVKLATCEKLWSTSSTKIRGVTKHPDGGYMVRVTKNGTRHYVGYFKTIEEAEDAKREFVAN